MHYWQGERITDAEVEARLSTLDECVETALATPLNPLTVLSACDRLATDLADPAHPVHASLTSDDDTIADVIEILDREALERKLVRELGGVTPNRLAKFDFREQVFESWQPVGLLAHVAPGNAPAAGALSALEGLLAGNVNIVKASSGDGGFTLELLAALADRDPTGVVRSRLIVLNFPSSRTEWLAAMCGAADAVAAWGGEEALAGVGALLRPGARLVDWGPKLSFAYLTEPFWSDVDTLRAVARDICEMDQQACSSPQVIYLDTEDDDQLFAVAERFAEVLATETANRPLRAPERQEWAEITNTVLVAEAEQHLGLTRVHAAEDGSWRVLADVRSALQASPLFRTVWVKPLPRKAITATLRPMRRYLQTVGLAADRADIALLSRSLFTAGVQRITVPGGMLDSYHGEPHDGVYALQRYSRRVDLQLDERFAQDSCLDDLTDTGLLPPPQVGITTKHEFETLQEGATGAEIFFRSGGSTGAPKLSMFTWDDYHEHMRFGAEGLIAAGFDPRTDRAMNLFFGGQLYGGFSSFYSALETMRAVQYPMAAQDDHRMVAESIVQHGVNTLLGMPNYLVRVFDAGADLLREYRGVRTVFYAGEHFPERQRQWLREEFGVEVIRSAAYGSVDAGPLGYQCAHSTGRVHHLFTGVQALEILDLDEDRPAAPGQTGRLVFSSYTRRGQRLDRYEIGDLGRWIDEDCPCGRRTPRFELLGRFGDIFRSGTYFLNYRRFAQLADDAFGYAGDLQILLDETEQGESITVRLESGKAPSTEVAARAFLDGYADLRHAAELERLVTFTVRTVNPSEFDRTASSGKLPAVVDRRLRTS